MPIDAVVRPEGKDYIFMVDENPEEEPKEAKRGEVAEEKTHFKKVEVTTGVSELGYTQITPLEKLPENTKVVTRGVFYLQSKSAGGSEH